MRALRHPGHVSVWNVRFALLIPYAAEPGREAVPRGTGESMRSAVARRASIAVAGVLMIGAAGAVPAQAVGTVTPPVSITTQPVDSTKVQGTDATFTAAATDATPADVPVTSWYELVPGGTWLAVNGSAGQGTLTLTTGAGTTPDGTQVHATFDDGNGGMLTTNDATLHIQVPPAITTQPASATVAPSTQFQLSAAASGTPAPTWQWETSSAATGPWTHVVGFDDAALTQTTGATMGTVTWYRAVFTNAAGSLASDPASITVGDSLPDPVGNVVVSNPSPAVLGISWTPPTTGGAPTSYLVEVLDTNLGPDATFSVPASQHSTSVQLMPGTYKAQVTAVNATGSSAPMDSSYIDVVDLHQTASLSGSVLRPFRDGFQDAVIARASSNFPTTGLVRIHAVGGKVLRSYTLSRGTGWAVAINGRTAAGKLLPLGSYLVDIYLGGKLQATRAFRLATSQVGTPRAVFSVTSVYPVKDGYRDSTRLAVTTDVPATMTVVITNRKGVKVAGWTQRRSLTHAVVWAARTKHGALPAGTYRVKITVQGGEGKARIVTKSIVVSGKYLRPISFTGSISASGALLGTAVGSCITQSTMVGMLSNPGSGSACVFGANLPVSANNKYANLKFYACVSNAGAATATADLVALDKTGTVRAGYLLGLGTTCYGGVYPVAALNGRGMLWGADYDGQDGNYYVIDSFRVSGTKYVLG